MCMYLLFQEKEQTLLKDSLSDHFSSEGDDCEIQFGESVLLPVAEAYRKNLPVYDPNYDDPNDDTLQFYIALDVS